MILREIAWRTPFAAFAPFAGVPHAHLLHGGERADAEWSTIVAFPSDVIVAAGNTDAFLGDLDDALARRRRGMNDAPAAPFCSGLVGFVGYEALKSLEPTLSIPPNPYALPDAAFSVYDAAAVFSRRSRRAFVVGRCEDACRRLEEALGAAPIAPPALPDFPRLSSNFTRRAYQAAVADVIERIRNGDFYQANISQRILAEAEARFVPFDLFRTIVQTSDARFAALLQYQDGSIVSNAPERFFRLDPADVSPRRIETEPIKGTRPRASEPGADMALARELLNDPKDRAENVMIADLMRNDLSKICRDGSIREDAVCELITLAQIHHLVSRISGSLREDATPGDVFRALFPSGSVTGAPKIEAMNAIAAVEGMGRGPYCGAIGYIDDGGRADFSVAIRTLTVDAEARRVAIPVGGGVTLRSQPEAEYDETLAKAANVAAAFSGLARVLT